MTSTQTEIERKYDVDDHAAIPDLSGIAGISRVEAQTPVELEAVYFDTDDGDLASRRITLRRRTGGKDEGWHLKLPAELGRTEVHAPLGRKPESEVRVPRGLLDMVRVHVRDRKLAPLARISTTRTAWLLSDPQGRAVAEVVNDAVTGTDVREGIVRVWREWEAELIPVDPGPDGDAGSHRGATSNPDAEPAADSDSDSDSDSEGRGEAAGTCLLDAIEERLVEAGARPSASLSKLAHALGRDGLGDGADVPRLPGIPGRPDSSRVAAEVAVAAFGALLLALKDVDPTVRRTGPDSVHRMRTIVRRMRCTLAAFDDILDREASDDLRDRLRRLGSVLGDARDLEVRADRAEAELRALPEALRDDDARRRLVDGTRDDYRDAAATAIRFLSSAPYYRLLDDLDAFVDAPVPGGRANRPADVEFARVVARESKRTVKRIRAARRATSAWRDEIASDRVGRLLHDTRRAARRLRYAVEAVEAVNGKASKPLGSRAIRLAKAAKRAQGWLGEYRDAALFAEHLLFEANRAHAAGERTFTLGVLHGRSEGNARTALTGAEAALRVLRRRAKRL